MRRTFRLSLTSLATALLMLLSSAPLATAATSPPTASGPGNGIRISPVRTDLTINPGQTQTVTVTVTNVTAQAATFQAIINDFVANPNETGTPALLMNPGQYATSHSLKRFASPISNFTLGAGQEVGVPVVITVPKDAAGGGYYGAVRFAPAVSGVKPGTNVSLAGNVASLILIKVPGNIQEELSIASFDVRHDGSPSSFFVSGKHLTITTRFQNEGNIQEQPFGKILLKRGSKIIAEYELNNVQPASNVLPDSVRRFDIPLTHVGSFGQYKLEGNFGYGSSGQLLSASTSFYVIPLWLIIVFIAVVLLLAFVVLGLPKLLKAYNRRILRKAGRRSG